MHYITKDPNIGSDTSLATHVTGVPPLIGDDWFDCGFKNLAVDD